MVEEVERYQKSIEYCDKQIVDYQYQKDKLLQEIKNVILFKKKGESKNMAKKKIMISLDDTDYNNLMELKNKMLMGRYSTSAVVGAAVAFLNAQYKKASAKKEA